jgi:hypothetical protein
VFPNACQDISSMTFPINKHTITCAVEPAGVRPSSWPSSQLRQFNASFIRRPSSSTRPSSRVLQISTSSPHWPSPPSSNLSVFAALRLRVSHSVFAVLRLRSTSAASSLLYVRTTSASSLLFVRTTSASHLSLFAALL